MAISHPENIYINTEKAFLHVKKVYNVISSGLAVPEKGCVKIP